MAHGGSGSAIIELSAVANAMGSPPGNQHSGVGLREGIFDNVVVGNEVRDDFVGTAMWQASFDNQIQLTGQSPLPAPATRIGQTRQTLQQAGEPLREQYAG